MGSLNSTTTGQTEDFSKVSSQKKKVTQKFLEKLKAE